MPRMARVTLANVPHHIIQRGNNRCACFYADEDYSLYLKWLREYADKFDCETHAYVLMTNHIHLLVTPKSVDGLANLMKNLGQRYTQYINKTYFRSGTLWEGRFKSCIVREDLYLLGCYRYIELNPIRAKMVKHPAEYRWSSYRSNAQGEPSSIITPHNAYGALGSSLESRQCAYRDLFKTELYGELVDQLRSATNANFALGSERFRLEIEEMLGRRVRPGKPGRPSD